MHRHIFCIPRMRFFQIRTTLLYFCHYIQNTHTPSQGTRHNNARGCMHVSETDRVRLRSTQAKVAHIHTLMQSWRSRQADIHTTYLQSTQSYNIINMMWLFAYH